MPRPTWFFEEDSIRCPCCGKDFTVQGWESALIIAVQDCVPYKVLRGGAPPPAVLCVNEHGHEVRTGYAVTYRCHGGLIDVGVLARPRDWRHGWWWPLGRVWWEMKEGA
jgi:transposase